MNEFRDQLGALALNVSKDFERASADDSAALIRRARRGRVVWTSAVGATALASAAAIAVGGSAAAHSLFGTTVTPASHSPSTIDGPTGTPEATESESPAPNPTASGAHDADDDKGGDNSGSDDAATHDANDDKGGGASSDDASGSDDSGKGSDDSGKGSDDSGSDNSGSDD